MDMLVLIGGFTVLCLLGMPVAYALGLAAILAALWIDLPLEAVMLKTSDGMDDFRAARDPVLHPRRRASWPKAAWRARIVNLAKVFVGFIRGGLALVNILASTFFGCISGSSVADTASIGSVMIPQMIKNGYPRLFAVNVTISGSLQPLLIPPSHNAVIYSLAAGGTISVAHLFIAGIIPGLLLGAVADGACASSSRGATTSRRARSIPLRQALKIARRGVLGPGHRLHHHRRHPVAASSRRPRSAAVACVYAFLVTMFIYRDYKWSELPLLVGRVVRTVGMVMIMIGFSVAFGYMMAIMQVPAQGDRVLPRRSPDDKYTFLLLRQHPAAGARHLHGPGADAADLHADLPAGDQASSASIRCTSASS